MRLSLILAWCSLVAIAACAPSCSCRGEDDAKQEHTTSERSDPPSPATPTASSDAAPPPQPVEVKGDGFTLSTPGGYREASSQEAATMGAETVIVGEREPGKYTANFAVLAPPPAVNLEAAIREIEEGRGAEACRELAKSFGRSAQTQASRGRVVQTPWGKTCEIEGRRPQIEAAVLTTIMRTEDGYVVVVGHFGDGDDAARAAYEEMIQSWRVSRAP